MLAIAVAFGRGGSKITNYTLQFTPKMRGSDGVQRDATPTSRSSIGKLGRALAGPAPGCAFRESCRQPRKQMAAAGWLACGLLQAASHGEARRRRAAPARGRGTASDV